LPQYARFIAPYAQTRCRRSVVERGAGVKRRSSSLAEQVSVYERYLPCARDCARAWRCERRQADVEQISSGATRCARRRTITGDRSRVMRLSGRGGPRSPRIADEALGLIATRGFEDQREAPGHAGRVCRRASIGRHADGAKVREALKEYERRSSASRMLRGRRRGACRGDGGDAARRALHGRLVQVAARESAASCSSRGSI